MNGISDMSDVLAIERRAPQRPDSTYAMIGHAAAAQPQAPALSFFLRAQDHERPVTWNYQTLFARITAAANFFHGLGVGKGDVIAFVLPNLPETHLTIWGGQAAGIVFAINPMLEPAAIGELLRAGGTKVLVTLAPFPGTDLWAKLQPVIGDVPSLRHLVLIDLAAAPAGRGGRRTFRHASSTSAQGFRIMMEAMHSGRGQGAKRSDTRWYREHLQRRHRPDAALSCFEISVPAYS